MQKISIPLVADVWSYNVQGGSSNPIFELPNFPELQIIGIFFSKNDYKSKTFLNKIYTNLPNEKKIHLTCHYNFDLEKKKISVKN